MIRGFVRGSRSSPKSRTVGDVRPARDKVSRLRRIDELAALGERLMEEAEVAPAWSPRRRAVAYRDGLMIALLAYRPVRLKSFAMMRLGRHLTKVGGCWQILFAADETKSRGPYEAIVPSALAPRLERYLDVHRQVLMRGERAGGVDEMPIAERAPLNPELDALWVSETGTQLEKGALARRIADQTKAAFGRRISPHMFRDAAATSIATNNPKHVGDASLVLGHLEHTMTETRPTSSVRPPWKIRSASTAPSGEVLRRTESVAGSISGRCRRIINRFFGGHRYPHRTSKERTWRPNAKSPRISKAIGTSTPGSQKRSALTAPTRSSATRPSTT
jgi:hypothetical protein